jgi:hypothetical protein
MQLPEADYSRGMSGLGREGQGAISAYDAEASAKLAEGRLAADYGKAYAQAYSAPTPRGVERGIMEYASAKAAIAHDVVQFAAEAKSWEDARQDAKAVAALSEYHRSVDKAEAEVSAIKTYTASELPTSINVKRFEKAPDGTDVERERIDQYEVAPQMFDQYEKGFSETALSKVSEGKAKNKLAMQIAERRNQGQIKMKTIHYKGSLEVMQNQYITAATNYANAGNTKDAVDSIKRGMEFGAFSLDDSRKLIKDILESGDETMARRELLSTNDPAKLEAMQNKLLLTTDPNAVNPYPNLSPLKRMSIAQTIDTKRIELEKAGMTMAKQQRTMSADRAIIDADARSRAGNPPTQDEIQKTAAKLNMTDTEYRSLQSTVQVGAKVETTSEGAEGTRQILAGLTSDKLPVKDDRTATREEAAEYYREMNEKLYQTKQISLADRNSTNSQIEAWSKKTYDSPDFKDAEKYINTVIGKPAKSKHSNAYELAQQDFVNEMRNAANTTKGKFNAMTWAQENAPRFVMQRDDAIFQRLVKIGAQSYVKFNQDRSIDKEKTLQALESARKAKALNDDKFANALNAVNDIPVVENK